MNLKLSTKLILTLVVLISAMTAITVALAFRNNERIIELQATKMAQTIAKQVLTDRKHYVQGVVSKLKGSDFAPQEGFNKESEFVPLPATFVMGVAEDISGNQDEYRYQLISRWNINKQNELSNEFWERGFENLVQQEVQAKASGELSGDKPFTGWKPYTEVVEVEGRQVLRFVTADVAVGQACVTCHNNLEQRDDIIALRNGAGVETGRTFELNDLMGAVAVDVDLEEAGAVAKAGVWSIAACLAACGGISIFLLSIFLSRFFSRPVNQLVARFRDIAEGDGDLTQRVDESRQDEIGLLGVEFNKFVGKIHDLIQQVGGVTNEVASASTEIAASSDQISKGIGEQSQQVTQVSAAIEEMSASIIEVARKSNDAASSAADSGKTAEEGGQVVRETVEGMDNIREAVSASASSVAELGKRGEQIGEITEVINDIADQTNLLALNAAIEAARAGEHGRGFAVVADEVRKLADRTTKATDQIAESIRAIQTETGQAVTRMNTGTEQVQTGVDRATQAGQSLEQIVSSARDVAGMIQSIAAAAEEQSAASEEVSRNVDQIATVTRQADEGTKQAAKAALQLSEKAETLQSLIGRFKTEEYSDAA